MTGEEFRQIRQSLNLSREKLAQKLGISSATIANAERAHAVKPTYERRILELKEDEQPFTLPVDNPFDALAAYNQATKALATMYRLAKMAVAPPSRPVGRPRSTTSVDAPSRAATRPIISEYLRRLQAEPDETERRALIHHWSLTTPETATHLRAFVDALTIGDIRSYDDPRITLPD